MIYSMNKQSLRLLVTSTVAAEPESAGVSLVQLCRKPVPAKSFTYWAAAKRLLSASCPNCARKMTLTTVAWRRWSGVNGTAKL